jgi:Tfp pilus assembly pilus retraction ATPase PilT
MDMLSSLCAAMVRANGDSLVLESGRAPYVLSGLDRHDVAKSTLSDNALEALVTQVFSEAGRQAFRNNGNTVERIDVPSSELTLMATARRQDDGIYIELRRAPAGVEAEPVPGPGVAADESLFVPAEVPAAPEHQLAATAGFNEWDRTPGLFVDSSPAAESEGPPPNVAYVPLTTDDTWGQVNAAPIEPAVAPPPPAVVIGFENDEIAAPARVAPQPIRPKELHVVEQMPDNDLMAWATDAAEKGASTVYLRAGSVPVARVDDRLDQIGSSPIDHAVINQMASDLEDGGDPAWQHGSDGEWSRADSRVGRVTCRVFSDDQGRGIILHLQPATASRTLGRLMPRKVRAACDGDGLIVVAAPVLDEAIALSSAVVDLAGQRRGGYIVALRPEGSARPAVAGTFVSQREFAPGEAAAAIRNAVSESPDILLIALSQSEGLAKEIARASEGGRLAVLSVAASTSLQAVRSLVGRSSSAGDAQVRLSLANSFRAGFTTRTMRRLGGGRVTIQDLLLGSSDVSGLLASGDFAGITRLQRQSVGGMFTVDERLAQAVRRGHVPLRQAVEHSLDRRHIVALVRAAGRTRQHEQPSGDELDADLQPVGAIRQSTPRKWAAR